AVLGPFLQDLHDPLADPDRGLPGLLPGPARQRLWIVEKDEVEIGGIIELAAAELAEREDREPPGRFVRRPLRKGRGESALELAVGEVGERPDHLLQTQRPGEVANAERERQRAPLPPDRRHHLFGLAGCPRRGEGGLDIAGGKRGGAFRKAVEQERQERRARARPLNRIRKIRFTNCFFPTTGCRSSVPPAQRLKPGTPTHVN